MLKFFKINFILLFLILFSNQQTFAGRYYDSEIGRFLSVDPKADKFPGWSSYNYCLNNPLKNIDPDGKEPITLTATGVATAGVVTIALAGHTYNYITNSAYRRGYNSFTSSAVAVTTKTVNDVWNTVSSWLSSDEEKSNENTKIGPYKGDVIVVDENGNAIPLKEGQTIEGNSDGSIVQVKAKDGKPTGTRKDGKGHPKQKDPKAKDPHGHRVDENGNPITDSDGNPHLPIKR